MALAYKQGTTGSSSGATNPVVSTAFVSSVTAGNLIVVTTCDTSGTTTGVTGVTDSGGNTYTQIMTSHGTNGFQMWYAVVTTGGASFTVSVSWNVGTTSLVTFAAQEFSGFIGTPTLDKSTFSPASGGSTSSTPSSGATATTTRANELVVGGSESASASSYTPGTGYTNLDTVSRTGGSVAQESEVVSSTGAQTATFTLGASAEWIAGVATFYDPAAVVGDPGIYVPLRIPNKHVGPMAMRHNFKTPYVPASLRGAQAWAQTFQNATFISQGSLTNRSIGRQFTGSFSATGSLVRQINRQLAATFRTSGSLLTRAITRTLTGTYSTAGSLLKSLSRLLTGTWSTSGALSTARHHGLTLTGTFSTAGALVSRGIARSLTATFSSAGSLTKTTIKAALTATFQGTGSLLKTPARLLGATFNTSGSLVKQIRKSFNATFQAQGSLNRLASRTLIAQYKATGSLTKSLMRTFLATYRGSGNLSIVAIVQFNVALAATFVASGSLAKQTARTLTATMSTSGFWSRFMAVKWTRPLATIFGGGKSEGLSTGEKVAQVQGGDKIETVSSGTKNETVQGSTNNDTIISGENKEVL